MYKIQFIPKENGTKTVIRYRSPLTGELKHTEVQHSMTTMITAYMEAVQGKLIQDAFPFLSHDEREILISGYDKEDWAKIFGGN